MISCWFPDFYTEYHKRREEGQRLAELIGQHGVQCIYDFPDECDVVFCASFLKHHWYRGGLERLKGKVPVVHYCWDLYPWQLKGDPEAFMTVWWKEYVEDLKWATEIWIPSTTVSQRVVEFVGDFATIRKVLSSARPWEPDDSSQLKNGDYVVNVMRKYPSDPNCELVWDTCNKLGIPCKETATNEPWSEFKAIISGARLLISPYYEASTGGLTLLEGYWHGKPILLSNSPMMGAKDYFGLREDVHYFNWRDYRQFEGRLRALYEMYGVIKTRNIEEKRAWMTENYSEEAFAKRIADGLKDVVNGRW